MSTGFRIFLLIVFAFGAIYAYRFREPQLYQWLRAQTAPPSLDAERDGLVSPVEHVLQPDVSLARLVGQPIQRSSRPVDKARSVRGGISRQGSSAESLPPEEQLSAADLADPGQESWGDPATEPQEAPADLVEAESAAEDQPATPVVPDRGAGEPREGREDLAGYAEINYKVEAGDNLWKIAAKNLGSGTRFGEIRAANPDVFRGKSTNDLATGTVLKIRIPAREDSLKLPQADADTTVEGNSASAPTESKRKASRPSEKQSEKSKRIAGW